MKSKKSGSKKKWGAWMLVRPSGTEPIIRVTVESKSKKISEDLMDEVLKFLEENGLSEK